MTVGADIKRQARDRIEPFEWFELTGALGNKLPRKSYFPIQMPIRMPIQMPIQMLIRMQIQMPIQMPIQIIFDVRI